MGETRLEGALDDIVDDATEQGSRLGCFPALYRHVTAEVARGN